MSAETGQLQRLTDEQVNARLAAYNGDGSLDRDVKLLREKVVDLIEAEVRNHFGTEAADRVRLIIRLLRMTLGSRRSPNMAAASSASGRRFPNI